MQMLREYMQTDTIFLEEQEEREQASHVNGRIEMH